MNIAKLKKYAGKKREALIDWKTLDIDFSSGEGKMGYRIFAGLVTGYCWDGEFHSFSADSVTEFLECLKEVKECHCEECENARKDRNSAV